MHTYILMHILLDITLFTYSSIPFQRQIITRTNYSFQLNEINQLLMYKYRGK